jgi:hypothetical protein
MEAMTQEFMLHRRPHVEIWSAREGSNDNASRIHFRNKSLMDPKQSMSTMNNRSTSEIWWISTNHGQSQIPQNWEKKPNHKSLPSYTSKKSDKAQPHHMSIWVHIRDTRRCLSNNRLTASNTHLKTKTRHEPNTGVLPWIRLHILSGIGGYAKSSLQGFSVDKSHVAEMANHNKMIIASTETGVDIRLASTSTTNPHCKGQIILRPDTMILRKLSTHAPQVVHEEIRCCLSNKRLTASHTKFLQNWTTHRDEWQLTNPDSQSDTQEAIQSERAKGTPLIQPS